MASMNTVASGPSVPNTPSPPSLLKAANAYTSIKVIYEGLPIKEQAKLFSEMKTSGF
jgi:hypothetical protein